jgi:hypothetical protein
VDLQFRVFDVLTVADARRNHAIAHLIAPKITI